MALNQINLMIRGGSLGPFNRAFREAIGITAHRKSCKANWLISKSAGLI
jgi:hypothetical protein